MNLPTKITVSRIILSIIIIILMLFPFSEIGIDVPVVRCGIDINSIYIICAILFVIASVTDYLDGHLARKLNMVTDLGKMLDAIADKLLINPILIIFASEGIISPLIPVVLVIRDIIVNAIKMQTASNGKVLAAIYSGKIKTATLMVGTFLLFINDWPFIYSNIRIDLLLIYFATFMSLVSMVEYYLLNKKYLFLDNKK